MTKSVASIIDELNEVAEYGYISFDDLELNFKYKIHSFGTYESSFSGKIRIAVRVEIDNGFLILPERFDSKVSDLQNLNVEKLYIIYKGRGKGKRINIQFVTDEEEEE